MWRSKGSILLIAPDRPDRSSSNLDKEAVLRRTDEPPPSIALSLETIDRVSMSQPPESHRIPRTEVSPR
jgi:hypothetical protein